MATKKVEVAVVACPAEQLALTNHVFVSQYDADSLQTPEGASTLKEKSYVHVKDFVFTFRAHPKIENGQIGLSGPQRNLLHLALGEKFLISTFLPKTENVFLGQLRLEVDYLSKAKKTAVDKYEAEKLKQIVISQLEQQVFSVNQKFVLDVVGTKLSFRVTEVQVINLQQIADPTAEGVTPPAAGDSLPRGVLMPTTDVQFEKAPNAALQLSGGSGGSGNKLFRPDWKFESMGIGGLDKEFASIFRRAFASRIFPPSVVAKLGINHVKGLLLYGPPGTGKTLLARQIGKMLNGKEPKVVNGPEILSKYVGQSEENIRNLFKDAEAEYRARGEDSELHIIVLDELDAICRARGSRNDSTGVGDTVVNQLLSKIDGYESLNNILLIGMTNRKELIDDALLRPGRMEVHMEISLPDQYGRLQILRIHTTKMRDNKIMDSDVDLEEFAEMTKNFSGAELEGMVRNSTSYAFSRQIDSSNMTKPMDPEAIRVTKNDFMQAFSEIKPSFGVDVDDFVNSVRNGIIKYSDRVEKFLRQGQLFIEQVKNSDRTPLISVLFDGVSGSGKTALAATLAKDSGFPYIRMLSAESLVGYSEAAKCARITKVFEDSYKSPMSAIVVDDIERILEYVPIGPRFSNSILQTLLVLLKKSPPKGRKLFVICTTSNRDILTQMDFMDCFSTVLNVPVISSPEEFAKAITVLKVVEDSQAEAAAESFIADTMTIKKLIMLSELAKQGVSKAGVVTRFSQIIKDYCS